MVATKVYTPHGVCSRQMKITYDDETNILLELEVIGGCNGNLQGISHLVKGMKLEEIESRLEGLRCGFKNTSCPDQISRAIKEILNK